MSSSSPTTAAPATVDFTAGQQSQLAISNGVLLAAVIFLFMVVVFVFLLYVYAKKYLGADPLLAPSPSSRFLFVTSSPIPRRGLAASVLHSLPVTVYEASAVDALECAVCLSEVAGGEKVRRLPKCGHGFHVECIDMWFQSHDTCPLCRSPVGPDEPGTPGLLRLSREEPVEAPVFPTNILFWGTQVSNGAGAAQPPPPLQNVSAVATSSSSGLARRKESLVIDIPMRGLDTAMASPPTPLPPSRMAAGGVVEEIRSPVSARLRSLTRLLSRGKQAVIGPSCSPRGDIEQGTTALDYGRPVKTPKTQPAS